MTQPHQAKHRLFETQRNAQGEFECYAVAETRDDDQQQATQEPGQEQAHHRIDPELVFSTTPAWAWQANELFQQSLASQANGGYSAYLRQMREQFEHMRTNLRQHMQAQQKR